MTKDEIIKKHFFLSYENEYFFELKEVKELMEAYLQDQLKEIVQEIKGKNPYPVNIFPEPSNKEWNNTAKLLIKYGRRPERIFAKWGRMVWEGCVLCMEDLIS